MIGSLLFLALGIVLTTIAFADYEDAEANADVVTELSVHEKEYDILLCFLGVFFTIFGFVLLGKCENVMVTNVVFNNFYNIYRIVSKSG